MKTYKLKINSFDVFPNVKHTGFWLEEWENGKIMKIHTINLSPINDDLISKINFNINSSSDMNEINSIYEGKSIYSIYDVFKNLSSEQSLEIFNRIELEVKIINAHPDKPTYLYIENNCNASTEYFIEKYLPQYNVNDILNNIEGIIFDGIYNFGNNFAIKDVGLYIDNFYNMLKENNISIDYSKINVVSKFNGNKGCYLTISDGYKNYIFDDNNDSAIIAGDDDSIIYLGDGNNILNTGGGSNTVYGGIGKDIVYSRGNDTIYTGSGDDEIHAKGNITRAYGGEGNDSYFYSLDSGSMLIDDKSDNFDEFDRIVFSPDITPQMLSFGQFNDDLEIAIKRGRTVLGTISIKNFFLREDGSNKHLIERFEFLYDNSCIDFNNGRLDYQYLNNNDIIYGTDFSETIEVWGDNKIIYSGKGSDIIKFTAQSGEIHLGSTSNSINIERDYSQNGNIDIYLQEGNSDTINANSNNRGTIIIHNFSNNTTINTGVLIYRKVGDDVHLEKGIDENYISSIIILKGASKYYDFGGHNALFDPMRIHSNGECYHSCPHGIPERIYYDDQDDIKSNTYEYKISDEIDIMNNSYLLDSGIEHNESPNLFDKTNEGMGYSVQMIQAMSSFAVNSDGIIESINQETDSNYMFTSLYASNEIIK